jgi:hypothetical protein
MNAATYFVPRETVKVNTQILHVKLTMRSVSYGIYTQNSILYLMDLSSYGLDIMNSSQDVRSVSACDKDGLLCQEIFKVRSEELRILF